MLTLYRYNYDKNYTQGIFCDGKGYIADSLELPWKYNEQNISCIPEGSYNITYREDSYHHIKQAYVIEVVPKRSDILIHVANEVTELKGCIAVGIKSMDVVLESRIYFNMLRQRIGDKTPFRIVSLCQSPPI